MFLLVKKCAIFYFFTYADRRCNVWILQTLSTSDMSRQFLNGRKKQWTIKELTSREDPPLAVTKRGTLVAEGGSLGACYILIMGITCNMLLKVSLDFQLTGSLPFPHHFINKKYQNNSKFFTTWLPNYSHFPY